MILTRRECLSEQRPILGNLEVLVGTVEECWLALNLVRKRCQMGAVLFGVLAGLVFV